MGHPAIHRMRTRQPSTRQDVTGCALDQLLRRGDRLAGHAGSADLTGRADRRHQPDRLQQEVAYKGLQDGHPAHRPHGGAHAALDA